jgi:hypothetical protein
MLFVPQSKGGKLRYNLAAGSYIREGARVVEWDGLENRCGLRSTEGSNPSLPAIVFLGKFSSHVELTRRYK